MVEPFINDICNMAESMLSKAANEKKPSFGPERPPSSRATKDNDTAADSAEQADDKHDAHQDDEEEAQVGASQDITNNDSSDNKPFTLGCGLCPIWLTENPLAWNVHAAEVHDFYWVGTGGRGFNREGITAAPTIASDEDLKIKKELIRVSCCPLRYMALCPPS